MTYLAPGWLWLLALVAVVAVVYAALQFRRRATFAVRFTNLDLLDSVAPRRPGWRRHVVALLFLAAACSLIVALARPSRAEEAPLGPTVVVAIDTSLSMEADDVPPTRLEAAQDAADELIETLPGNIRLGLVTFNGVAQVAVAPTEDREQVEDAIDRMELGESTAIGEAIFASLDAIALANDGETAPPEGDDGEDRPANQIVLMSDGETTVGRPDASGAQAALDGGVPITTIAFGTDQGTIDIEQEPGPIPVPVNEAALESIADTTGGDFFTATTADELGDAFADIGGTVTTDTVQREVTTWFLGLGVALLLATGALSLLWFSRLP
jgi:Ca-activated chloride channel family protein